MSASVFPELGADHACWLVAVANNYLGQRRVNQAVVLLELLSLVDPANAQGQLLLAYAYLIGQDQPRLRATLRRLARLRLTARDRSALEALRARLDADNPELQHWRPSPATGEYRTETGNHR